MQTATKERAPKSEKKGQDQAYVPSPGISAVSPPKISKGHVQSPSASSIRERQAHKGDAETRSASISRKERAPGPLRSLKPKTGPGRQAVQSREEQSEVDEDPETEGGSDDNMEMEEEAEAEDAGERQKKTKPAAAPARNRPRFQQDDEANEAEDATEKNGKARKEQGDGKKIKTGAQQPAAAKSPAAVRGSDAAPSDKSKNEVKAPVLQGLQDGEISDDDPRGDDKKRDDEPKGKPPESPLTLSPSASLGDRAGVMIQWMSGLKHSEHIRNALTKVKPESRALWKKLTSDVLTAAALSNSPLTDVDDPDEVLTSEQMLYHLPSIVAQAMAISSIDELMPKMRPEEVLNMKQELLVFNDELRRYAIAKTEEELSAHSQSY